MVLGSHGMNTVNSTSIIKTIPRCEHKDAHSCFAACLKWVYLGEAPRARHPMFPLIAFGCISFHNS